MFQCTETILKKLSLDYYQKAQFTRLLIEQGYHRKDHLNINELKYFKLNC